MQMTRKPAKKAGAKSGGIVPREPRKGQFQKGISGNPGGAPKNLFGTRDPFKQALIRSLKEAEEAKDPRKRANKLADIADNLMREAAQSKRNPVEAIRLLATTLDGKPTENVPPVQFNTFQLVLQSIRNLNLTDEQLEALENGTDLGLPDLTS